MCNIHNKISVLVYAAIMVSNVSAGVLDLHLPEFHLEAKTLAQAADQLSQISKVSICSEDCDSSVNESNSNSRVCFRAINQGFKKGMTLKEVLTTIVESAPDYIWTVDEGGHIINIYPKTNSPLGWIIDNITVTNKPVNELLAENSSLGLIKHGIVFDSGMGNISWLETKVTYNAKHISARDALNKLCGQLRLYGMPMNCFWTVSKEMTWKGRYMLRIKGVSSSPEELLKHIQNNPDFHNPAQE